MSGYFDHVRCHNCNAHIDPERIEKIRGKMSCPACGEDLAMTDLFGIKASFMEDDGPQVGLDDLVPGSDGHFENPWGAGPASAESQGSYQWATAEEKEAYASNLRGAPAESGQSRNAGGQAPPVRSVGVGGGGAPPVRSVGLGGGSPAPRREIPAGAVRARHIDPPPSTDARYTEVMPTPEPAPKRSRRYGPPSDAKAEDNAMVHVPSEEEFPEAKTVEDSSLDELREMKERRKKKRRRF